MYVAVISAGRPTAVRTMAPHLADLTTTWYVPITEVGEYRLTGAGDVVGTTGLCQARNLALDRAEGEWCTQVSDDLRRLVELLPDGTKRPVGLAEATARLKTAAMLQRCHLAGASPTDNPYFVRTEWSKDKFIVGDLLVIDGACPLRFDTDLKLKEDYDYTLQHLARYGRALRWDALLATFTHRTNRGGAVAYRTPQLEQATIAQLKAKWPGCIVDNPRRPNEVLLRWRPT